MSAFMFPGQGSQRRGMGRELFDSEEYAKVEREVDAILGYSLRKLCVEDPENCLKETQYTQPSLYVVNALHWFHEVRRSERPTHVIGHSLGEYNALFASGAFDFLTGLRLVQKRGELMSRARNGGMVAVIGIAAEQIATVLKDGGLLSVDLANYNAPLQTVISGQTQDIERAAELLERAGAKLCIRLPVSAAFHSRYMTSAAEEFGCFIDSFSFRAPTIPVIANVTARPYTVDSIRTLLVRQMSQSVRWMQGVRYLMDAGVAEMREIGPGNVLTQLVRQNQQPQQIH